ncbi:hypothetical protein ABZW16_43870, partial [Nocardia sp. NPDC004604]
MPTPIVMAHLAEQLTRGGDSTAAPRTQSSGGIRDILGGLLGGSGGIGGAIGEALAENAGGALGSMLDGLFGRKTLKLARADTP